MSDTHHGKVIVNFRRHSVVEQEDGTRINCVVKGRKLKPVAGDNVLWEETGEGGAIIEIRPRHGVVQRYDTVRDRQILAANVDQAVIVNAIEPALDWFTLDKYLAAAEASNIAPLIALNKIDLANDEERRELEIRFEVYRALDYPVSFISIEKREGLETFLGLLAGKTNILVGPSGVGKSAISSLILPDEDIRIGDISSASGEGRHTTTATTLYHMAAGGELIDSPGVREYRLWPMPPRDIAPLFREIRRLQHDCRFANCLHTKEPGCAVKAAVGRADIHERRYASYLALVGIMEDQYKRY